MALVLGTAAPPFCSIVTANWFAVWIGSLRAEVLAHVALGIDLEHTRIHRRRVFRIDDPELVVLVARQRLQIAHDEHAVLPLIVPDADRDRLGRAASNESSSAMRKLARRLLSRSLATTCAQIGTLGARELSAGRELVDPVGLRARAVSAARSLCHMNATDSSAIPPPPPTVSMGVGRAAAPARRRAAPTGLLPAQSLPPAGRR